MSPIHANLEIVHTKMAQAAERSGRKAEDVTLVAVSKTVPAARLLEAVDAGQRLFGENRVQELVQKQPELPQNIRWHVIGHLQSNKVRKALPLVEMIQSIDRLDIARDVNRIAGELGLFPKVLLEVNVATESSKFGFAPETLSSVFEELLQLPRLEIEGLMCIPPVSANPEDSRQYFVQLRTLRDRLEPQYGVRLRTLSMGMSGDYAVAVEEGATLVRVGSAIFGSR